MSIRCVICYISLNFENIIQYLVFCLCVCSYCIIFLFNNIQQITNLTDMSTDHQAIFISAKFSSSNSSDPVCYSSVTNSAINQCQLWVDVPIKLTLELKVTLTDTPASTWSTITNILCCHWQSDIFVVKYKMTQKYASIVSLLVLYSLKQSQDS